MGGVGSGGSRSGPAKPSTAGVLRLDVRHVVREVFVGAGRSGMAPATWTGSWGWSLGDGDRATIGLTVRVVPEDGKGTMLLDYRRNGVPMSQRIPLEATQCNYGGQRWWARCDGCQRRVAVLWGPSWRCRRCHGLAYRTSQLGRMERLTAKARRLQSRLGGDGEWELFAPPEKPRWMHWRTYERLARELKTVEARQLGMIAARFPQFMGNGQ